MSLHERRAQSWRQRHTRNDQWLPSSSTEELGPRHFAAFLTESGEKYTNISEEKGSIGNSSSDGQQRRREGNSWGAAAPRYPQMKNVCAIDRGEEPTATCPQLLQCTHRASNAERKKVRQRTTADCLQTSAEKSGQGLRVWMRHSVALKFLDMQEFTVTRRCSKRRSTTLGNAMGFCLVCDSKLPVERLNNFSRVAKPSKSPLILLCNALYVPTGLPAAQ